MTSEEDNISVSGSPAVIRRRLGVVDNPNKEDNLSPGSNYVYYNKQYYDIIFIFNLIII